MPSRAGHKKSRNGCLRCKQRRVKCDEQRPCRDCVRRGERCSLVSEYEYDSSFSISQTESPIRSNSSLLAQGGFQSPGGTMSHSPESDSFPFLSQFKVGKQTAASDWSQDLFLMNHYTRSTSMSFSNVKSIQVIWESLVPEMAADHKFLMHGLLALSAFHLCHLRPSEKSKYVAIADHHQGLALSHFRPVLPSISESNCKPAVCMAIVLSVIGISALSRPRDSGMDSSDLHTSSFNDILGVFSLTRGVAGVLEPAEVWLQNSPINVMFHNWQLDSYDAIHLPEEVQSRFDTLRHEIIPSLIADATSNLAPCLAALDQLVEIYKEIQFYSSSVNPSEHPAKNPMELEIGILLKWTTNVPAEFVTLLRHQNTAALIILAHYVITMMSLGERWFSKNWSENALQMIKEVIDPSGLPWLRWPEDNLRKQQQFWQRAMVINTSVQHTKPEELNLDRNGFYKRNADFARFSNVDNLRNHISSPNTPAQKAATNYREAILASQPFGSLAGTSTYFNDTLPGIDLVGNLSA